MAKFGVGLSQVGQEPDEKGQTKPKKFGKGLSATEAMDAPREKSAWEKYQELPWNEQLLQAVDDMARLGVSGVTFGLPEGLAKWAGNDKYLRETDEARQRAGLAGTGMEIAAGVASPVARAISAGGGLLAEGARSAAPWASKVIPTARAVGEGAAMGATGAALSGRTEDIGTDTAVGAALPVGLSAAAKVLGPAVRTGASYLSGVMPDVYETAYQVGREGGVPQAGWREGRKYGGGSQGYLNMMRKHAMKEGVDLTSSVDLSPMAKRLGPMIKSFMTSDNMANMTKGEMAKFAEMKKAYGNFRQFPATIETVDAFRRHLDTWAAGKDDIAELAKAMQRELVFAAGASDPRYMKLAMDFDIAKKARAASASSKKVADPRNVMNLVGMAPGGLGYMDPILLSMAAPGLLAASPRGGTAAANVLGKVRGLLDAAGTDPAKLGLLEYQREKRSERR